MARPVMDLPEPLSPTMPKPFACPSEKLTRPGRPRTPLVEVGKPHPEVFERQAGSLAAFILWIKYIAQPVTQQVEGQAETVKIASPGTVATHQWSRMKRRPSEIMAPHSGLGGCAPRPRKPRPAAARMMPAISSVTRTISEEMQSGQIWLGDDTDRTRPPADGSR